MLPAVLMMTTVSRSFCQQKTADKTQVRPHLVAIAKGYEDSVVIRWDPADPITWVKGNKNGYDISRVALNNSGQQPVTTLLSPRPVVPEPKVQLLQGLDTTDPSMKYLRLAERILYGNIYSTSGEQDAGFAERVKDAHGALNLKYMLAMMSADYSHAAAGALALRWVDKNVKKGAAYIYVIKAVPDSSEPVTDSATAFVVNVKTRVLPPQGLLAKGSDRKVAIEWSRKQTGRFSAYNIQRSDDGGKTYHTLNKGPYHSSYIPPTGDSKQDSLVQNTASEELRYHEIYPDSIAQNYKTYYYRIQGVNPFGEWSSYSPPIAVHGRDLTAAAPPIIDSLRNIQGREVKMWWRQPKHSPDLAGYLVDRGDHIKGPFTLLTRKMLGTGTTSFIDTGAIPHQANYYMVITVDTAGNIAASQPQLVYLTDSVPPAAPLEVTGVIDTAGVVHLHWAAGKEPDLLGYEVFSSYNPHYIFSMVSHRVISGNTFTDTISMKTLDRKIYYKVRALDRNYNNSQFSAITTLKKPVVIPPSPPLAGEVYADRKGAHVQWFESRSAGAMGYQVYRKEKGTGWRPLAQLSQDWDLTSLQFTDSTIKPNTDYYYSAETIDSTGIHSERSSAVHVRGNKVTTLPALDSLRAFWDRERHAVRLSWKYADTGNYFFIIYRSAQAGPLAPWHSFDENTRSYEDGQVKNGVVRYAIQVVYRDKNASSALSRPVVVQIQDISGGGDR